MIALLPQNHWHSFVCVVRDIVFFDQQAPPQNTRLALAFQARAYCIDVHCNNNNIVRYYCIVTTVRWPADANNPSSLVRSDTFWR